MAKFINPQIATNGLVMYYDMTNTKKSWKGQPTVNLFTDPSFASGLVGPVNGGGAVVTDPRNANNKVVKFSPSAGNQYNGRDITVTLSSLYSYQMEIYVSADFNGTNVMMYPEQAGSGAGVSYDLTKKDTWQTLTYNGRAASTTNTRMLAYVLSAFTTGYVMFTNVQVEQNAFATPFVNGTRSTAQAIVDLTNNNTLTASSLTYASDNTFSFNGSSNYIDVTGSGFISGMSAYTIMHWSRRDIEGRMPVASLINTAFYQYGDNSWKYMHGGVSAEYYYPRAVNIPLGTYGFYCIVYNGANVSIYRNGVFEGSQATTGTADWSQGLKIGNWSSGSAYSYSGAISSVSFYNRALSAAEVAQNFNALRSRYSL